MALNRMRFMNTYIDNITLKETLRYIEGRIEEHAVGQVIPLNVDQIVRLEWDSYFREICENSDLLLADGHPLLWIAKWYGRPIKEKICGSDLAPILCREASKMGYSVFFLGAASGVAEKAAKVMQEKYSGLKVAGTYSPPIGFEKDEKEIKKINRILLESRATILFVGMGVPKQEMFIYENMHEYKIPLSVSVGATIDFIAGEQKRAPRWMTDHGMEWLYRLCSNPKRMFRRYIIDDTKVIKLFWKYRPKRSGCVAQAETYGGTEGVQYDNMY